MASADGRQRRIADRYVLKQPIGRGGMGVVWEADDTLLDRAVAIKEVELPATLPPAERDQLRRRVLREARAAARLSHQGTVTLYDVVREAGRTWIVMELIQALTLSEIVHAQGPLSPRQAAAVGRRILEALEAAHRRGIVHRDVKPGNVMVLADGRTKLADFGIASLRGDPEVTATGTVLGSPSYMAPEQAGGEQSGPAADLWALGATMYFAVEGEPPFSKGGAIATLTAVVHDQPRPMQRAGPLAPVITALLVKEPEERPAADEILVMLDAVTDGPASLTQQLTATFTRPPWRRQRRRPVDRTEPVTPVLLEPTTGPWGPTATTAPIRAGTQAPTVQERTPTKEPADDATAIDPEVAETTQEPADDATAVDTHPQDPATSGLAAPAEAPASGERPPSEDRGVGTHGEDPRRRAVPVLPVVVALVVATLILVAVVATRSERDQPAARRAAGGQATAPSASPSGSGAPSAPSATQPMPAPDGWSIARDARAGYVVAHPRGWQRVPRGATLVDFRRPGSSTYLRVDWTDQPGPSALGAWRDLEARFARSHSGYERIRLEPAEFRRLDAAVWEYRYTVGGQQVHAVNLNFINGSGEFAYALNFQTSEQDWPEERPTFTAIERSFRFRA